VGFWPGSRAAETIETKWPQGQIMKHNHLENKKTTNTMVFEELQKPVYNFQKVVFFVFVQWF
jgi:hypothetical protein